VHELEEVDRDRIGDEHLPRPGTQHLGQHIAGSGRRVDPIRPAPDDPFAPLVDLSVEALAGGLRQAAQ
jgi:hypothetical protein